MWEEAVALERGGNPALQSMHEEGVRVLLSFGRLRRVLALAVNPLATS